MADPYPPRPTSPPVIVEKKHGPGCWGCGCGILLLVLVLLAALAGGLFYFLHAKGMSLTAPTASTVRTYDGGDAMYQSANQQVGAFEQRLDALNAGASPEPGTAPAPAGAPSSDAAAHPVTLTLTADEINTLLARDPNLASTGVKVFVTISGDSATIEMSAPTDLVPNFSAFGLPKDRYLNLTAEVSPTFDSDTKAPGLRLRQVRLNGNEVAPSDLSTVQSVLDTMIPIQIQQIPGAKQFFDHLQSISIHDGALVIVSE